MRTFLRAIVMAVALLSPATASAEWFVFPFAAANAGGDTLKDSAAFGGSFGLWRQWLGAEVEATTSPSFFEDGNGFRSEHRQTTYSASALVGRRLGTIRPYASVGGGWLRSRIKEVGGLAVVSDDRPAFHVGGGLIWAPMARLGLRGEARYVRSTDDTEPTRNVFAERLADFSYWRIGAGASIGW